MFVVHMNPFKLACGYYILREEIYITLHCVELFP